jgi:Holliday junction resolvase RusA-like endonuclease
MTHRFTIPGAPRGKGRPRFTRAGGFPRAFTDEKTASYENLVALAARQGRSGVPAFNGPLTVTITFYLQRPKRAPRRVVHPATRPDLDNLVKAVLDGCNQAGIWMDDAQVVELRAGKRYGDPRCEVEIASMAAPSLENPLQTSARIDFRGGRG